MNTGIVIMGIILVSLCTIPFVLAGMKRRKKNQWFLEKIKDLAAKHRAVITKYDYCRDFIIGMDEKSHQLFYFQFRDETELAQHINLKEVSDCKVINRSHAMDNITVVDQVMLTLKPKAKHGAEINLKFFSSELHTQLDDELPLSAKWSTFINQHLG